MVVGVPVVYACRWYLRGGYLYTRYCLPVMRSAEELFPILRFATPPDLGAINIVELLILLSY